MITPRIPRVEQPDDIAAEVLAAMPQSGGRPSNLFATLAHHPVLCKRVNILFGLFLTKSSLTVEDREVVILRVAARSHSHYELSQHIGVARSVGFDDARILAVATATGEGVSLVDRDLVMMTDELLDQATVSDGVYARLTSRYRPEQLLELFALVGSYRMLAGVLNASAIASEEAADPSAIALAIWIIDAD